MKLDFAVWLAAAGLASCTAASFDSASNSHHLRVLHHAGGTLLAPATPATTMQHHKGFLRHNASADSSVHVFAREEPAMTTTQIILYVLLGIGICGICCCITLFCMAAQGLEDDVAKRMATEFDRESGWLTKDQKAKYSTPEFRKESDDLFDEVDTDKSGSLTLNELRGVTLKYVKEMELTTEVVTSENSMCKYTTDFRESSTMKAFDTDGDSKLDKDEFFHLMKLLTLRADKAKRKEEADKMKQRVEANKTRAHKNENDGLDLSFDRAMDTDFHGMDM
jgi:hypothetical protein